MRLRRPTVDELSVPPLASGLPMIVEPSTAASATIAQADAPQICRLLEAHGAVLLRGWSIQDSEAFASAISALCKGSNLRSLDDYCPAEYGRDHPRTAMNSSTTIWPTNRLRTTGGYLQMEVVPHTECSRMASPCRSLSRESECTLRTEVCLPSLERSRGGRALSAADPSNNAVSPPSHDDRWQ